MNPFNPLNPQGPPCPADHPLSFSETLLYVSQVAFLALAGYIALLGPHQGRAYLSGRVSRFMSISGRVSRFMSIPPARMQALTNDLDVWITTQLDKNDANIVKSAILQGVQTGENFTLDISHLRISSLPLCLANLKLTGLNCSECPLLAALPALLNCTSLDCSHCPLLTALPALPSCTELNCSRCPLLTALPAMPPNAIIHTLGCPHLNRQLGWGGLAAIDLNTCPIYWKTLNEEPLKVLKTLLPYLKGGSFPKIVFLNEDGTRQEGSDAGGLRRTLMSELFAQLSKRGCIPKNPGTELLRPTAAADAEEKEILEALGLLFVSAADRNLPIGQIFDLPFFTDLQAFSGQNLGEYTEDPPAWIKKQCSENSSPMAQTIRECQTLELLKENFSEYPFSAELDLEGAKLFVLNACLEETVKERSPWYEAAYLIASAMKGIMGSRWENLCALSPEAFQGSIEGAFSKEAFAAAIQWQGRDDAPTKAFLLKWIDTHDEEHVKELLQFSTGSRSLTGEPVYVMISPPNIEGTFPLPTSHTCARQLCLPTGCSSQQMFDDKIKQSLDAAKATGFLFA